MWSSAEYYGLNQLVTEKNIEIEKYIQHTFLFITADNEELKRFCVLLFLKIYDKQLPKLTRIVRIIYSVPFTSVPIEF